MSSRKKRRKIFKETRNRKKFTLAVNQAIKGLFSLVRSGEQAAFTVSPRTHKMFVFFYLTFFVCIFKCQKAIFICNAKFREFHNQGAKNFGLFLLYSLLEKGSFRYFCSLFDLFSFTSNRFNPLNKFPHIYL